MVETTKLTIEFHTTEELKLKLQDLCTGFGVAAAQISEASESSVQEEELPEPAEEQAQPPVTEVVQKKRGRKPKALAPAVETEAQGAPSDEANPMDALEASVDDSRVITIEDVRAKLNELTAKTGGIDAAKQVLKDVGAARIPDIKPGNFAKVINLANRILTPGKY